jgi:ATP-dependent helicase/nuclease subunit B
MASELPAAEAVPECVTVHVGDIETLLDWAEHASYVSNLTVAPVELHRRNLKLRLTEANRPLDAFAFTDPTAVASRALETAGKPSKALDRVDRLALLGDILGGENEATNRFRMVLGGEPSQSGNTIEQARRELEVTTNYHPVRMRAFRQTVESAPSPIDVDAGDLLDETVAVERALRRRSQKSPSDGALIRHATRTVIDTDGSAWTEAYPSVERIALVGLSTVPATLVDLFSAVTAQYDVEGHVFLRRGTGPFLEERLADVWSVPNPGQVVVT